MALFVWWLPGRATPIYFGPGSCVLQPLGLAILGSFERHSGNLRRPEVKPQLEGKTLDAPHARHNPTYVGHIDAGWHLVAINAKPRNSGSGFRVVTIRAMNQTLTENGEDADQCLRTKSPGNEKETALLYSVIHHEKRTYHKSYCIKNSANRVRMRLSGQWD
jgi:hypothetical protein